MTLVITGNYNEVSLGRRLLEVRILVHGDGEVLEVDLSGLQEEQAEAVRRGGRQGHVEGLNNVAQLGMSKVPDFFEAIVYR